MHPVLWSPSEAFARATKIAAFTRFVQALPDPPADSSYDALHRWSLARRGEFWAAVWRFAGVIGDPGAAGANPAAAYVPGPHMTDARWFPGAALNFAEDLLRPAEADDRLAVIFRDECGAERVLTRCALLDQATAFARFLSGRGVTAGDRVAAVLPNVPEAVVAMLGTAAIGAVWSSCSPDFGEDAVVDRFGQIEPTVLVTCAATTYAGKPVPVLDRVRAVLPRLPSVRTVVVAGDAVLSPDEVPFAGAVAGPDLGFAFERFPFAHPLAVLYSSGTTGVPKGIIHGAGGTLLQHLKEHQLHSDLRAGDRLFFYTTTGWMMWNWLVSALASGATIVLYDGSPFHPDPDALWRLAADARVTHFGAGAKYFSHLDKLGVKPRKRYGLDALRVVLSTGSPLLPESFDFVYRDVKADVLLASISGGTDIVSCFALGCPAKPVVRGELQAKGLGMDVRVFDPAGQPLVGEPGELVCASPFPSMPVGFWNDPDKAKYRAAYFGTYDNVWCHGDWAEETASGGLVITGRSDTTLNPGGVRIGTAEITRQVEAFPDVAESLAVPLRRDGDEQVVLFVRMKPGGPLTPALTDAIRHRLRTRCSPRHVPAFVVEAPDFPRTVSGKLSEVAVRDALNGRAVRNTAALANPDALAFFAAARGRLGAI